MQIVFFNHYHNGDIFASKGYIADLIKELKEHDIFYQHLHSPKLLKDLNIEYRSLEFPMGPFHDRLPFFMDHNTVFINTWAGNYLQYGNGINWQTYRLMFEKIYSLLENVIDRSIEIGPIEYYFPEINYEYFDIPNITIPENSIIISNGPVLSGQSNIFSIDSIVPLLLDKTDSHIILTHYAPFQSERVSFTNNLINTTGGDLNEIAWISEQCKYIIGRNSGPFCFMNTKNNLNDSNKTLISIGNKEEDSFVYGINLKCNYHFVDDSELIESMEKIFC